MAVRRDEPDAVHSFRAICRRLRRALRTFRPLLVDPRAELLRGELSSLADCFGSTRPRGAAAEAAAYSPA